MSHLPSLQEAEVSGKTVLVRADCDVDLDRQHIVDDTRLQSVMATVDYLLHHHASVIILSHLGRPDPLKPPNEQSQFSLLPIARWFARKFPDGEVKEEQFGDFPGWQITPHLSVIENLRYYKGEEANEPAFAESLASLGQIYVDDAFAVSHRAHASMVGIPKLLPHVAGLHLQKEVEVLSKVIDHPDRPLVVIIGGAKIETKLPLVEKMHKVADYVLVGGEIAEQTKILLKVQHEKLEGKKSVLIVGDLTNDKTDITPTDIQNFLQITQLAKTIVWNGPIGLIRSHEEREKDKSHDSEQGTRILAKGITESDAYTVIGGGDTLAYLKELHLLEKFSFVSTGGGAMLSFLSGEELPALKALTS